MRELRVLESGGWGFGGFEGSLVELMGSKEKGFLGVEKRKCFGLGLSLSLRNLRGGGDGGFRRKRDIFFFSQGEEEFCYFLEGKLKDTFQGF